MHQNLKPNLKIRFATVKDVDLILSFIRDLAHYEQLLHEVIATPELLKHKLFGPKAFAEVILCYFEEEPAGFALFFHNFSTFLAKPGIYIEDLYVKPEMRGLGIGKALLKFLAALVKERDCGRLEWWVLDWNKDAIEFYKKIGAKPMDDWTVYRVTGEALTKLALESPVLTE